MAKPRGRPITNTRVREIMEEKGCSRTWAYKLWNKEVTKAFVKQLRRTIRQREEAGVYGQQSKQP